MYYWRRWCTYLLQPRTRVNCERGARGGGNLGTRNTRCLPPDGLQPTVRSRHCLPRLSWRLTVPGTVACRCCALRQAALSTDTLWTTLLSSSWHWIKVNLYVIDRHRVLRKLSRQQVSNNNTALWYGLIRCSHFSHIIYFVFIIQMQSYITCRLQSL